MHLFEINFAPVTLGNVLFEAFSVCGGKGTFEVVGYDFDQLLAG